LRKKKKNVVIGGLDKRDAIQTRKRQKPCRAEELLYWGRGTKRKKVIGEKRGGVSADQQWGSKDGGAKREEGGDLYEFRRGRAPTKKTLDSAEKTIVQQC